MNEILLIDKLDVAGLHESRFETDMNPGLQESGVSNDLAAAEGLLISASLGVLCWLVTIGFWFAY